MPLRFTPFLGILAGIIATLIILILTVITVIKIKYKYGKAVGSSASASPGSNHGRGSGEGRDDSDCLSDNSDSGHQPRTPASLVKAWGQHPVALDCHNPWPKARGPLGP